MKHARRRPPGQRVRARSDRPKVQIRTDRELHVPAPVPNEATRRIWTATLLRSWLLVGVGGDVRVGEDAGVETESRTARSPRLRKLRVAPGAALDHLRRRK